MTPFPHLKEASQEAGENPGVRKFQRKLLMNLKGDFFWDTLQFLHNTFRFPLFDILSTRCLRGSLAPVVMCHKICSKSKVYDQHNQADIPPKWCWVAHNKCY